MRSAHIYIKGNYIEIQAEWFDMSLLVSLKRLERLHAFTAKWDIAKETYTIPLVHLAAIEAELRRTHNVFLHNAVAVPAEPVVLRVEYIGACKRRQQQQRHPFWNSPPCRNCGGTGTDPILRSRCRHCFGTGNNAGVTGPRSTEPISYATAWVNNGWNCLFPEKVLREFFPVVERFDGDFFKALLKGSDLSKEYKKLARQFHPDVNRKRDAHEMFVKLKEAYTTLQDPMRRKRYEAGLRFQVDQQEVDVGFRIPRSCGDVVVEADGVENFDAWKDKITVKKIISWNDVVDEKGRVMCSSFNPAWHPKTGQGAYDNNLPFIISWEYPGEFEIDL